MALPGLAKRIASRRSAVAVDALHEAAALGDEGEHAILAAWEEARGFSRVMITVALGDRGRCGPADEALRQAARSTGPGTQDLRCAAVLSLAKRGHEAATPELMAALAQRDSVVREYAVVALAAVGDARAWDDVLAWFSKHRPRGSAEPPSQPALSYLLRHLPGQPPDQRAALVRVIREKWPALVHAGIAGQLATVWPAVSQDGPADPGDPLPAPLGDVDWAQHPLIASTSFTWSPG